MTSSGEFLAHALAPVDTAHLLDAVAQAPDAVVDGMQAVVWRAPAVREVLASPLVTVEMPSARHGDSLVDRLPAMTDDPAARAALAGLRPLLMPTRVERERPAAARLADALLHEALASGAPVIDLARIGDAVTPLFLRRLLGLESIVGVDELITTSRDVSVVALAAHGLTAGLDADEVEWAVARLDAFDRTLQEALPAFAADQAHPLHEVAAAHPAPLVAAAIAQIVIGGMDTVSASICLAVLDWVGQGCPTLSPADAEALWERTVTSQPPIRVLARRTRRELRIDASVIPASTPVVIPTRLAVATDDRSGDRSLAFGWGEHRCIGRAVARVTAVETLLAVQRAWPRGLDGAQASGRRFPWIFDGPAQLDLPVPPDLPPSDAANTKGAVRD